MTGTFAFPRNVFLGFDHIFNELDHITKHAQDTYPPHNVVKEDKMNYENTILKEENDGLPF